MITMKMMLALALTCYATVSHATTVSIPGIVVQRTLVDDTNYGACMALLSATLADSGLDCRSRWVTFSCSGDFQAKDVAWRMFDSAQMALALELKVKVVVDDTRKHNGYCYAPQISVFP